MSEFYTPRRSTTRTVPPGAPKSKKYYKIDRVDKVVRRLDFTDIPRKRQFTHGYVNYRPKRRLFEIKDLKEYKNMLNQEMESLQEKINDAENKKEYLQEKVDNAKNIKDKNMFDREIDIIVRDDTVNEIKRDIESIKCDLRKITDVLFECYFLEKEDYLEPEIKLKRENAFCKKN